jgi:hypothetical protein
MLPLLVRHVGLKTGYAETQDPDNDRDEDSNHSRHHNMSRTALPLEPALQSRPWCRGLELVV